MSDDGCDCQDAREAAHEAREIAVDWDALNFAPDLDGRDVVPLELTRDQIKAAPLYRDRRAVIVIGSAGTPPATP